MHQMISKSINASRACLAAAGSQVSALLQEDERGLQGIAQRAS
jgi:hypothetical protein